MPDMTDVVGLMEFLSKRVQITPNTHLFHVARHGGVAWSARSDMNFQANTAVNYSEYLFCSSTGGLAVVSE